jgi:hypothetical protein
MGVFMRVGRVKAFLRDGKWKCANAQLERRLNRLTDEWIQETGGPPIDDSDHERTVAEEIAGRVGGKIARHVAASPNKSARIYIDRRQLRLDFG